MSHVENHCILKLHLRLFDEFDENSRAEYRGAEEPEEKPRMLVDCVFLEKQIHKDSEHDDAEQSLINLSRMACRDEVDRRAGSPVVDKLETPRQGRLAAVNLGIHQVSQADERASECHWDDNQIQDMKIRNLRFP